MDSNETKMLFPAQPKVLYSAPGWLLFVREGALLASNLGLSAEHPLFQVDNAALGPGTAKYDVTKDGQRFLVNTASDRRTTDPIVVLLNWMASLQQ